MPPFRNRAWNKYRPYAVAGARYGARLLAGYAGRKVGGYLKSRSIGQKSRSGSGVTTQFDRTVQYRRKRMPRRKRKRWVNFVKKASYVEDKKLASNVVVFNNSLDRTIPDTEQQYAVVHMYGGNGEADDVGITSAEIGLRDIKNLCDNDDLVDSYNEQLIFKSAVLDMTINNTGVGKLELDIYEIVPYTRDARSATSWTQDQISAQSNTPGIGGSTSLNIVQRGVTPFDFPLMSKLGYRVLKKTKFFTAAGQAFTYQMRDAKNRYFPCSRVYSSQNELNYIMNGMTKSLLIIGKIVVGDEAGTQKFTVGCTRRYVYSVKQANQNLDWYS